MSDKYLFLSDGQINLINNNETSVLSSSVAENYKKKLKEIIKKNEWKRTGSGARFMGTYMLGGEDHNFENEKLHINSIAKHGEKTVAYSLNTGEVGGLYIKDILNPEEPEVYILVKEKIKFYDIDINKSGNKIIASIADSYLERHLALVDMEKRGIMQLTEGDSCDANPVWSRRDEKIIYYDSCGLGLDGNQNFIKYGAKSILCYNTATGDLTETFTGDKFDFYKPFEDSRGNLYYIKRPYNSGSGNSVSIKDVALVPIKILKAIFGWLNFFTQRYSGESLKTNGNNPAKARQKSQEQIFIDGNLLEVEKNLKQNAALGEKNPGYAPASWELNVKKPDGSNKIIKKGVTDYCVLPDGSILYSNGKYIIKLAESGQENIITKAHLAFKLIGLDAPDVM